MSRKKKGEVRGGTALADPDFIIKIQQLKQIDAELLGNRLRKARRDKKVSQRSLTKGLFTSAYLSSIELGKTRPTLETLESLAERLDESLDYFLRPDSPGTLTDLEEELEQAQIQGLRLRQHLFQCEAALALADYNQAELELNRLKSEISSLKISDQIYYHLLGACLHNRLGNPGQALFELEQSAKLQEQKVVEPIEIGRGGRYELETGRAFKAQRQYVKAQDYFQQGLDKENETGFWRQELLLEAGETSRIIGEFERAANFYAQTLALYSPEYTYSSAQTLNELLNGQVEVGNIQEAAFMLGQIYQLGRKAGENAARLEVALKASRLNLQLENLAEARHYAFVAESSARLDADQPGENNTNNLFAALVILAQTFFQAENFLMAQLYLDQAEQLLQKQSDIKAAEQAEFYYLAARFYVINDQKEQAGSFYEKAINLLEPLLSQTAQYIENVNPLLSGIYFDFSQLLKEKGKIDQAMETLEKAFKLRS